MSKMMMPLLLSNLLNDDLLIVKLKEAIANWEATEPKSRTLDEIGAYSMMVNFKLAQRDAGGIEKIMEHMKEVESAEALYSQFNRKS